MFLPTYLLFAQNTDRIYDYKIIEIKIKKKKKVNFP